MMEMPVTERNRVTRPTADAYLVSPLPAMTATHVTVMKLVTPRQAFVCPEPP